MVEEQVGQPILQDVTLRQHSREIKDGCIKFLVPLAIAAIIPYPIVRELLSGFSVALLTSPVFRQCLSKFIVGAASVNEKLAVSAAVEDTLRWQNTREEQDTKKIGYILGQSLRYHSYFYDDECDANVLKQFEPDYELKNYRG